MPLLTRLHRLLDGPPLGLPPALDRAAERWARLGPRARLVVAAGGVVVLLLVAGRGAARSPWGPPTQVLVATADLPAGHTLGGGDLRAVSWPATVVPQSAVPAAGEVSGKVLSVGLPAGAVLLDTHLGGGLAAELDGARAAVAVTLPDGAVVTPGSFVDVVSTGQRGPGRRLATDARVLAVQGTTAWLSVTRAQAPAVAAAGAWGEVSLVLLPARGGG